MTKFTRDGLFLGSASSNLAYCTGLKVSKASQSETFVPVTKINDRQPISHFSVNSGHGRAV